jgi:hypothetical protein
LASVGAALSLAQTPQNDAASGFFYVVTRCMVEPAVGALVRVVSRDVCSIGVAAIVDAKPGFLSP